MDVLGKQAHVVFWNLTKRCNLSCPHCAVGSAAESTDGSSQAELSCREARFVIDELSYLNKKLTLVLSGGEPMLREDICDIVESASQAGFTTVLDSNGTLLSRRTLLSLKDAGLRGVGVTISALDPVYHDAFTGLKGAWERAVSALREAREIGLETIMEVSVTEENWIGIRGFVDIAAVLGAASADFFFLACPGAGMKTAISTASGDQALRLIAEISTTEKRLRVRARCVPHITRIFQESGRPLPPGATGCMAGRQYIRIDAVGNVTPCPFMSLRLGNVREISLSEIWENSPWLGLIRDAVYTGRCGDCSYADICGGCRARALAIGGVLMGEDSICNGLSRVDEETVPGEIRGRWNVFTGGEGR